ncbi:MAG: sporulation protein YjcZ [Erysipelotrichaceae bacterium]|nr:sporulation protein YjcZ [Erysipelotrichaceae bacterium]
MNSCAGQCQGKGGTFLSFILVLFILLALFGCFCR